jgi:predicted NUDIX family NTP pyrophosphohydrolase
MTKKTRKSAGLLVFRRQGREIEVFLAHMGGPFWARKDGASWSIPKGEFEDDEDPLEAAKREFREETGLIPTGKFIELAPVKQSGGKTIFAWAVEWDCDATAIKSNTFTIEWPPESGKMREFPEIDRVAWFSLSEARRKILKGQMPLLDQLEIQIRDANQP